MVRKGANNDICLIAWNDDKYSSLCGQVNGISWMNKIVKLLPGLTGAVCGYVLSKSISWTGLTFELVSFMLTCLLVTVLMESAVRSYGNTL